MLANSCKNDLVNNFDEIGFFSSAALALSFTKLIIKDGNSLMSEPSGSGILNTASLK